MAQYVWYAGYGSNLDRSRFNHYIKGGVLDITGRDHAGSRDPAAPVKQSTCTINHELYFSKSSSPWEDKAVAFIKATPDKSKETLCVLYLVTKEQFLDIMIQENGVKPPISKGIPNLESKKRDKGIFFGESDQYTWYGRILYLGEHDDGNPIFSFTSKESDDSIVPSEPGKNYLKVIGKGLMNNFGLTTDETSSYLLSKPGIAKSTWSPKKIKELLGSQKFMVSGTNKRISPDGHFIVQLNLKDIEDNNLSPNTDIAIVHETGEMETLEDNTKKEIKVKVVARLHESSEVVKGKIHLDQTIRAAIGVNKMAENAGYYAVSIAKLNNRRKEPVSTRLFRFGQQRSIARVLIASFTDMEVDLCRIRESTMECIGIENGDKIVVESVSGRINIRAVKLSEQMAMVRERKQMEEGSYSIKNNLRHSIINQSYSIDDDLPIIFIDYDARKNLGIKPGDPVIIYRNNGHAIFKNIQSLTIPLVAILIAIVQSIDYVIKYVLEAFGIDMGDGILIIRTTLYMLGFLSIIWYNLLPIRNKFKR